MKIFKRFSSFQLSASSLHSCSFVSFCSPVRFLSMSTESKTEDKIVPQTIIDFWFGKQIENKVSIKQEISKRWYFGGKEFDDEIRDKFGAFMHGLLEENTPSDWGKDAISSLALVLVGDQFTRNIYRGDFKSLKYDPRVFIHPMNECFSNEHNRCKKSLFKE